jgi:hypothetical protein
LAFLLISSSASSSVLRDTVKRLVYPRMIIIRMIANKQYAVGIHVHSKYLWTGPLPCFKPSYPCSMMAVTFFTRVFC